MLRGDQSKLPRALQLYAKGGATSVLGSREGGEVTLASGTTYPRHGHVSVTWM
ncbi:hypothetical protein J6590_044064 [Homalodisca vitripennis]|nr:hypothetical protein J6590_044064 [Homalodisca vitripennis]